MVLVTGGTGFIGSHLLEKLIALGEPVRCLVRRRKSRSLPPKVEVAFGDLASGEGVADALRGADAVIHLAGVTKALSVSDYYTGNARATEVLVRAMEGSPARLVHVSSLAAIGPCSGGRPVEEDDEPHPLTHYGRSKLEAENVVRRLDPRAVIVRPPVVYGPRDTDLFQLLQSISRGLVLEIAGGERWFSAIYVGDLADGLIAALRTAGAAGRTYFLAHSKPVSWSQLSAAAARIMSRRVRTLKIPASLAYAAGSCSEAWSQITRKPGIVSRDKVREAKCDGWTCDTRRASAELGFTAATTIEAGLELTLPWYKEAGWLRY